MWQRNFNNISCFCSKISKIICWIYNSTRKYSFNLICKNFCELYFFLYKITLPCSNAIVVYCQTFWWSIIEKSYFICNIHANWISNQSFSTFNLFWNLMLNRIKTFKNIINLLTSQITSVLSSWPPREARYFSSNENERLWIRTLWSFNLWTI